MTPSDREAAIRSGAERLARRVLEYVGPIDDPDLECDVELRAMARELLQISGPEEQK